MSGKQCYKIITHSKYVVFNVFLTVRVVVLVLFVILFSRHLFVSNKMMNRKFDDDDSAPIVSLPLPSIAAAQSPVLDINKQNLHTKSGK